jgi:hypothetical protein
VTVATKRAAELGRVCILAVVRWWPSVDGVAMEIPETAWVLASVVVVSLLVAMGVTLVPARWPSAARMSWWVIAALELEFGPLRWLLDTLQSLAR